MAVVRRGSHKHRPMRYHFLDRDRLARQETPKPNLLGAIICKLAQTHRLTLAYPLRKQLATSLPPRIAKIADPLHGRLLESRRHVQNHARFTPFNTNRTATSNDSHRNIRAQVSLHEGEP